MQNSEPDVERLVQDALDGNTDAMKALELEDALEGETMGPIGSWTSGSFQFAYGFPGVNLFEGPFTRETMSGHSEAGGTFEGDCGTSVSAQTRTFTDIGRVD